MTRDEFLALPCPGQLVVVFGRGTFLARRWNERDEAVSLYRLPSGLLVEVSYEATHGQPTGLAASVVDNDYPLLADYATFVQLPDWLPNTV